MGQLKDPHTVPTLTLQDQRGHISHWQHAGRTILGWNRPEPLTWNSFLQSVIMWESPCVAAMFSLRSFWSGFPMVPLLCIALRRSRHHWDRVGTLPTSSPLSFASQCKGLPCTAEHSDEGLGESICPHHILPSMGREGAMGRQRL